jgi:hypothetical protein
MGSLSGTEEEEFVNHFTSAVMTAPVFSSTVTVIGVEAADW